MTNIFSGQEKQNMERQINGLLLFLLGSLIVITLIGATILKYLGVVLGVYLIVTGLKLMQGHRF